jgi:LPXTG-site transpeptidase (sortase) family protein
VQVNPTLRVVSQMLTVFAALTLGFLLQLTLVGGLQHDRDQAQSFRELRTELAIGTTPLGALGEDGKLLPSGTPVAILEIPRLDLKEVILEGSSSRVLMSGAGHRRDTVLPGQAGTSVVLGRHGAYGGPFGGIDRLRRGDEIIVTTGQGRHTFTVLGVRRAGDPLPPALASGQGRLNLVTSDGPTFRPTDVLRVDANLTSPAQPGGVQIPSRALPANEAVMAGDSGALLPLALWGPLLLAAALATVWVRHRAGRWQAWVIGLPVLALVGVTVIDTAAALLPNLL